MKLLSFCNVWRVKRCHGRDLSIAALPYGYLVNNSVRHVCRTAVSGKIFPCPCNTGKEDPGAHAAVPKVEVEMWVELCSMTRESPKSASLQE